MIMFMPSAVDDIDRIKFWAHQDIDPDHQDFPPRWWLTGTDCIVSFRLDDADGPVLYVRMDDEAPFARLHTQFAPESEVPKKRLITALLQGFPILAELMKEKGFKGIIFESRSESLINFMGKLGFNLYNEELDDYLLLFQEKVTQ